MLLVRLATPPALAPPEAPAGVVSSYLFQVTPGSELDVSGPYGHFFANESDAEMIFIAGGAGMAPMRSHILDQLRRIRTTRPISFWYGARSPREIIYRELFDELAAEHPNFEWTVAISECGLMISNSTRIPFSRNATQGALRNSSTACQPRRWNRSIISTASIESVSIERSPLHVSIT